MIFLRRNKVENNLRNLIMKLFVNLSESRSAVERPQINSRTPSAGILVQDDHFLKSWTRKFHFPGAGIQVFEEGDSNGYKARRH